MNLRSFFYGALAILIVGIAARQITLVSVGLLAALLLGAAWIWQRFCLTGVSYARRFSEDHVFWGETVDLMITLVNRKPLPLSWIETEELLSDKLEFVEGGVSVTSGVGQQSLEQATSLRWFERVTWHYHVLCEH